MSQNQMIKFALVFSSLAFLICGLAYSLLRRRLGLTPKQNRKMLGGFLAIALLMIVCPIAYRYGRADIDQTAQKALQFIQYFFMGWVAMILLTFVILEIISGLIKLFSIPFKHEKRKFLTEGMSRGFVAGTSVFAVAGLYQAVKKPNVQRVEISLPTLPQSFDGFTMAQISDVHVGPLIHHDFLNTVVDQVLELDADVILITGDLVDGTVDQLRNQIEPLRKLKAKQGVYFCTGNHEYYSGAEEWIAHLESMGIHTFRNSNVIFRRGGDRLMLGGVYDWQASRYLDTHSHDPFIAAKSEEPVECKILMAHNPFSIETVEAAGWNFQVSGHTHAGQFYPFAFIVKSVLKHNEGLYKINEKTQLYVNRGTGYWGPPNRFGINAEITHHVLRSWQQA